MPDIEDMTPGEILAEASVADFITSLGLGIAEAQTALDENSVNQIAHFVEPRDSLDGKSLLDLGLSPAFYHYQHADISTSLQVSLRVEKEFGLDLNLSGSFNDQSETSDNRTESSTETTSRSRTSTTQREARIEIAMSTQGALQVAGNNYQLEGADPRQRIETLASRLRGDSNSGVERVLPEHECAPVNPTVNPTHSKIVTTPNTVAFLGAGTFSRAVIRISEVPVSAETYTLKSGTSVEVQPGASVEAHAQAVAAAIQGLGYQTSVIGGPGRLMRTVRHDFDVVPYKAEHEDNTQNFAGFLRDTGYAVDIEGYTDRSGPAGYNLRLGKNRGLYMRERLLALGVPANQLPTPDQVRSRGEQRWADENQPDGQRNEAHRITETYLRDRTDYFIIVRGDASHEIVRSEAQPSQFGNAAGTGNGFLYVYKPENARLTGSDRRVDIGEHRFPLDGSPAGGQVQDAPESYAANLARDINANSAAGVRAWAEGNVVHLCPQGAKFTLALVTTSNREISLSGSEDITVTQQFSRSESRNLTQERSGNRTVAVGASLDIRYQKQFEMNVTGNSSISARLVAIPAPPEFLATIKEYLS